MIIDGNFTFNTLEQIVFQKEQVILSDKCMTKVEDCYRFLKSFSNDKIIYGINTGFGPMAQYRISDQDLKDLQYNIIRSHSSGAGQPLNDIYVRAAMIVRLSTFLQAHSGVHIELVKLLVEFINREIYPFVPEHGSVGASGDLVQLAHIALALIGEGSVHYKGEWRKTNEVLQENGLKPFSIYIREGLSVTNGTSVMSGIGFVNVLMAERLLHKAILFSVWINEITAAYDDSFCEPLNAAKRHKYQCEVAKLMREIAKDSHCLQKRENVLYENVNPAEKVFKDKVQSYYSIRCVPQILAPVMDTLCKAKETLENEINSACDNPIIDTETQNVYHGGNFHGDYVSFEMDKVKIAVTKMSLLIERQLNYLCHDRINNILPPFLNLGILGLNYGLQAAQFTATSTTAENQTLSNPMYIHSIPNNNDNQDIVSMGTNAALITGHVIENAAQVMAIQAMALAQATDYLRIADKLSTPTRDIYINIRSIFPILVEDRPLYEEIEQIKEMLKH
ncbi:MAG: aromatic amino acid ammonia-lyase [Bacteroidales bacterium]|jgi:histidine ammonia-lyase|nr:aromatic amino acid ammonia-lyase [Bacteroidales bacterium]